MLKVIVEHFENSDDRDAGIRRVSEVIVDNYDDFMKEVNTSGAKQFTSFYTGDRLHLTQVQRMFGVYVPVPDGPDE